MKISRFIHYLNESAVWNALTHEKIKLSRESIEYIKNNKNKELKKENIPYELLDKNIITTKEDEEKLINELVDKTTDKGFQSLYLITTTSCNMNCDYCFYRSSASKSLMHHQNMSFETCKKAIDKFYEIVKNNEKDEDYWQQITFYGGEPLLNKKMLMQAIPYAKEKFNDKYTSIVINTNILLLDDEVMSLFKKYDVEVQVSLDGKKEIHDLHRKTMNNKGTYDIVIKNMKKLLANGIKVLPMITCSNENVKDFKNTLKYITDELQINDYAVNILITDSYNVSSKYSALLAKEMLDAYLEFGQVANDYSFVDLYELMISKSKKIAKSSCGATRKITVFPDETVYACQALEKVSINKMGTLDDDFINNPNWEKWRKRNKFLNEECLDCKAVGLCGGGCATGSYNGTKSIYGIDKNQCEYTKSLFDLIVK